MRSKEEVLADLQYEREKLTKEAKGYRTRLIETAGRHISDEAKENLRAKIAEIQQKLTDINRRMNSYREPV